MSPGGQGLAACFFAGPSGAGPRQLSTICARRGRPLAVGGSCAGTGSRWWWRGACACCWRAAGRIIARAALCCARRARVRPPSLTRRMRPKRPTPAVASRCGTGHSPRAARSARSGSSGPPEASALAAVWARRAVASPPSHTRQCACRGSAVVSAVSPEHPRPRSRHVSALQRSRGPRAVADLLPTVLPVGPDPVSESLELGRSWGRSWPECCRNPWNSAASGQLRPTIGHFGPEPPKMFIVARIRPTPTWPTPNLVVIGSNFADIRHDLAETWLAPIPSWPSSGQM